MRLKYRTAVGINFEQGVGYLRRQKSAGKLLLLILIMISVNYNATLVFVTLKAFDTLAILTVIFIKNTSSDPKKRCIRL
jgi:hypothetical protein